LSGFPKVHFYQLDRGMLENDLRAMNQADGVHLLERVAIQDVTLGRSGQRHVVEIADNSTSQRLKNRSKVGS